MKVGLENEKKKKGKKPHVYKTVVKMETKQGCPHPSLGLDGIADGGFDNGECVWACFGVEIRRELSRVQPKEKRESEQKN